MHITINGKRWRLEYRPLRSKLNDAHCDHPAAPAKAIVIDSRLKGQNALDAELHEALHAADWSKDEEWVERVASDLARMLWRLGYRKGAPNGQA